MVVFTKHSNFTHCMPFRRNLPITLPCPRCREDSSVSCSSLDPGPASSVPPEGMLGVQALLPHLLVQELHFHKTCKAVLAYDNSLSNAEGSNITRVQIPQHHKGADYSAPQGYIFLNTTRVQIPQHQAGNHSCSV